MSDHLSFVLGQNGYKAYKYVPFGPVHEVLPYLVRRAQENSDIMQGVGTEMKMLRAELKRRWLPGRG
jgi:proline dehydrogenase